MTVAVWGQGTRAEARAEVLRTLPLVRTIVPLADGLAEGESLGGFDAVFVALPPEQQREAVAEALRQGTPLFLEWPPAQALADAQALVELAQEAGAEVGVSRPLRFHPAVALLRTATRPSLILLRSSVPEEPADPAVWRHHLADVVDLCCALARSSSARRVDAETVRSEGRWPRTLAFSIRFHNATFAQVNLRRGGDRPDDALHVGGPGYEVEADLAGRHVHAYGLPETPGLADRDDAPDLLAAETAAFLDAIRDRRPAPVSLLDGLHTLRLVERVLGRLR